MDGIPHREAAKFLFVMSQSARLRVLALLLEYGEMTVGDLAKAAGLRQTALSQHLALLRDQGLVANRREKQRIHYRVADNRVGVVLALLAELYPARTTTALSQPPGRRAVGR